MGTDKAPMGSLSSFAARSLIHALALTVERHIGPGGLEMHVARGEAGFGRGHTLSEKVSEGGEGQFRGPNDAKVPS
jgi:hypothetical protein